MIDVVAAAIFFSKQVFKQVDDGDSINRLGQYRFLSVRRASGSGAGDWEFPGGKVEEGETLEQALHREIREELGLEIRIHRKIGVTVVSYPQKQIRLHLFLCSCDSQKLELVDHDASEWLFPSEFLTLSWSAGDLEFVRYFKSL